MRKLLSTRFLFGLLADVVVVDGEETAAAAGGLVLFSAFSSFCCIRAICLCISAIWRRSTSASVGCSLEEVARYGHYQVLK